MLRRFLRALPLVVLASVLASSLGGSTPIRAESLTISPPKLELPGSPGDILTEKIKLSNDSSTDGTYTIELEDFKAVGDDGSVDFVDPSVSKDTFSLARWISLEPTSFTIPAGQEKVISFTIRIPRNAEPGGHYGSVVVKRGGEVVENGATVESRVGTLILLRVTGNVKEALTLDGFQTKDSYQQFGPVDFNMRFKNEGNVHVAPTGTIVISNIFGKKVKEIAVTPTNVLPDALRTVKATWDDKNMIGRYTASLVLNYGQEKKIISGSTSFIVFPLYLIVVIIVLLVLIYLLITQRKGIKRLINNLTRD